jgi:DNA-binding GntR family transcriptional regulator
MSRNAIVRGVRQQIVDRLRGEILSGRLADGERLSELQLAKRFQVSRGPIREAFVQLSHEGLLVAKPNCGVRVAPSAPDSIRKLVIPIRCTIETYALERVFDDLNADDFAALDAILDRLELACRRGDWAGTVEPDIAFHRYILERAGQPDLLAIWTTIVARVRRHFQRVHKAHRGQPIDVYARHKSLVEVFKSGDKDAAVRALEKHIA